MELKEQINEYLNLGKSVPQIALENNIRKWVLYYQFKKLGIMRSRAETKIGKLNPQWIGDKIKYNGLHTWIRRYKIKPQLCEICNKVPPKDLANISGEYKRDINDFKWLCRKCHMESDGRLENLPKFATFTMIKRRVNNETYKCSRCFQFKNKNDFHINNSNSLGITTNCKDCRSRYDKIRYYLNKMENKK